LSSRVKNWWGWGFADARPDAAQAAPHAVALLGFGSSEVEQPVAFEQIALPPPRIQTPFSAGKADRIRHAYGRSYLDTVRAFVLLI
jgi:alkyldihydroxyacetonephosphate synthase